MSVHGDRDNPPAKRMRQTNITDCFKTQADSTVQPEDYPPVNPKDPTVTEEKVTMSGRQNTLETEDKSVVLDTTIDIADDVGPELTEEFFNDIADSQTQPRSSKWVDEQSLRYAKFKTEKEEPEKPEEDAESLSLGTPIADLKRRPDCAYPLPELRASVNHTVLFDVRSDFKSPPQAWPDKYKDKWDDDHVRMPCSPHNYSPKSEAISSRWQLIVTQLNKTIKSSYDLEDCILSYNQKYKTVWNFDGLHTFFNKTLEPNESQAILTRVLPRMAALALRLPQLCTQPIPMLKRGMTHSITLSQQQTACLLANAFFCTFPRRSASEKYYYPFPTINFVNLFKVAKQKGNRVAEKLKCLFHYFHRVTRNEPHGTLTFTRRSLEQFPRWESSTKQVTRCHVSSSGTIEMEGSGMLQVDFANKRVGGGVLGWGCVQEEIRFITSPELILSRLFTMKLENNECLVVTGCEQYCLYEGYADNFAFVGKYVDHTPRDSWGRRFTQVLAIDATSFKKPIVQYSPQHVIRESNKAYCGFYSDEPLESRTAVATGNWGCGVFRGDPRLKFLLQLMAATETGRDLVYFTFKSNSLCKDIHEMHSFLIEKRVSVGALWKMIENYDLNSTLNERPETGLLYNFIYNYKDNDATTVTEKKSTESTSSAN